MGREIRQLPGLGTVGSSASLVRPEVIVRPDPARAADLGVSTADIAAATRVATLLIGIAVKNSILLVDYAVMAEEKGMTRHEALMDACHKRARPVIMTTLAMGAGMMPIALGLTADASFRMPMAVAVIGGLITSTVLSLVVVPECRWPEAGLNRGEPRLPACRNRCPLAIKCGVNCMEAAS